MGGTQFGIFAKHWRPGKVKTRLAADIGEAAAAKIYRQFVKTLLLRFDALADRSVLSFWPPEAEEAFQHLSADWQLTPQAEGDLGQRMQNYFQSAFEAGHRRVVLIGSDSPNLPTDFVKQAFAALDTVDMVLGPTRDGGFYLIGVRDNCPDVFAHVPWSTPQVWQRTLKNIEQVECSLTTLPPWYDVDELQDLLQLQNDLASAEDPTLVELRDVIERELHASRRSSE